MKGFLLLLCLATLLWPFGQTPPPSQTPAQSPSTVIRVETSLVNVPVSVTDAAGRFVTGLTRADFELLEDNLPQEIASFDAASAPLQVALLLDTSSSASSWLPEIRQAALRFVRQLQPQDRVLIVTFDEVVNFRSDFSNDRRQLQQTLNAIKSSYLTTVYDGISQTITQRLAALPGRKALVLFTDGVDTLSKQATCASTLELVTRTGVLVYPVHFNSFNFAASPDSACLISPASLPPSYASAHQELRLAAERQFLATSFLRALANQSGARYLRANELEKSAQAFLLIADELRHQYTLGYYSTQEPRAGAYRTIRVRLNRPDVRVRARPGYRTAPATTTESR